MPPWAAVPGYGEFANDNALTQREIDFLVSWAESYGPRNNGEVFRGTTVHAPAKPVQARTDFEEWELGKPDVLLPDSGEPDRRSEAEVGSLVARPRVQARRPPQRARGELPDSGVGPMDRHLDALARVRKLSARAGAPVARRIAPRGGYRPRLGRAVLRG